MNAETRFDLDLDNEEAHVRVRPEGGIKDRRWVPVEALRATQAFHESITAVGDGPDAEHADRRDRRAREFANTFHEYAGTGNPRHRMQRSHRLNASAPDSTPTGPRQDQPGHHPPRRDRHAGRDPAGPAVRIGDDPEGNIQPRLVDSARETDGGPREGRRYGGQWWVGPSRARRPAGDAPALSRKPPTNPTLRVRPGARAGHCRARTRNDGRSANADAYRQTPCRGEAPPGAKDERNASRIGAGDEASTPALVGRLAGKVAAGPVQVVEPGTWPEGFKMFCRRLNYRRPSFGEQVRRGLLMWMSTAQLKELSWHAGDFWCWRSAILDFNGSEAGEGPPL